MPLLKIRTNIDIPATNRIPLLKLASENVAGILNKPERYVMVMLESNPDMLFAGSGDPLAYLELKSIGLPQGETKTLSQALCQLITEQLGIDSDRIYIEFADAQRHMWGWDGGTFER